MRRRVALVALWLVHAAAGASETLLPPVSPTSSRPAFLRPAKREPAPCGVEAGRAAEVLDSVARTGRIDLLQLAALQRLVAGEEALRHPDLAVLAQAVAFEQDLPLEGVTPARREALLDAIMAPVVPESNCLPATAALRLRGLLLAVGCIYLHERSVPVERWAQDPVRPYLLLADRGGPPLPDSCGRVLRGELGDPASIELGPVAPQEAAYGQGSAIVPPSPP